MGICFRCAISKHRTHTIVNIDELSKTDLDPMVTIFDSKIELLREKAASLLEKTKTQETNAEKLPEIVQYFEKIKEKF